MMNIREHIDLALGQGFDLKTAVLVNFEMCHDHGEDVHSMLKLLTKKEKAIIKKNFLIKGNSFREKKKETKETGRAKMRKFSPGEDDLPFEPTEMLVLGGEKGSSGLKMFFLFVKDFKAQKLLRPYHQIIVKGRKIIQNYQYSRKEAEKILKFFSKAVS